MKQYCEQPPAQYLPHSGTAVTAMPANATTPAPAPKTLEATQQKVAELEKTIADNDKEIQTLRLNLFREPARGGTSYDSKAIRSYEKAQKLDTAILSYTAEVKAYNNIVTALRKETAKKTITATYSKEKLAYYNKRIADNNRFIKIRKAESNAEKEISRAYEKAGTTWKIQRPIQDKFSTQGIWAKYKATHAEHSAYQKLSNATASTKSDKVMSIIGAKYDKALNHHVEYKSTESKAQVLKAQARSHDSVIDAKRSILSQKNSEARKEIRNLKEEIAKLKTVK